MENFTGKSEALLCKLYELILCIVCLVFRLSAHVQDKAIVRSDLVKLPHKDLLHDIVEVGLQVCFHIVFKLFKRQLSLLLLINTLIFVAKSDLGLILAIKLCDPIVHCFDQAKDLLVL